MTGCEGGFVVGKHEDEEQKKTETNGERPKDKPLPPPDKGGKHGKGEK